MIHALPHQHVEEDAGLDEGAQVARVVHGKPAQATPEPGRAAAAQELEQEPLDTLFRRSLTDATAHAALAALAAAAAAAAVVGRCGVGRGIGEAVPAAAADQAAQAPTERGAAFPRRVGHALRKRRGGHFFPRRYQPLPLRSLLAPFFLSMGVVGFVQVVWVAEDYKYACPLLFCELLAPPPPNVEAKTCAGMEVKERGGGGPEGGGGKKGGGEKSGGGAWGL